MKRKSQDSPLARVGATLLCCLLALLSIGCATRPATIKQDDPLFGTWINEEYDKLGRSSIAKIVMFPDGRNLHYAYIADADPVVEFQNTIEKAWIDAEGNHWYRIHAFGRPYSGQEGEWEEFTLVRVSMNGTVLEANSNRFGYLEELDPLDPWYSILYKQE